MPESHEDKMEVSLKVVQSGKPKKAAHGELPLEVSVS